MRRLLSAIFVMALLVLTSCQNNDEVTAERNCHINFSNTENSVWQNMSSRAAAETKDFYYVLDANAICQSGARTNHATPHEYEKLLPLGTYNVYCITNADPSGISFGASMIGADYSTQAMVLNTLTDVCLGQQPLAIVASKTSYDVNVLVDHILAKLALTITKVPADIETIALTLGNVSKTFTLNGTFADDGTMQTLDLQPATTANADGTLDWTLPEALIYPCQSDATSTVITIIATDTNGKSTTYNTSATTVCSSGTRSSLTTTWNTLTNHFHYSYTETPWTETIQQGTFDM